jgi:hypothetical protein
MCDVPFRTVLDRRQPKDFPALNWRTIDLITTQQNVLPVGSALYKAHKYPSDVDIMERIEWKGTWNDVRLQVTDKLQMIAQRVKHTPNTFIGDFKAGEDERFNFYIGQIMDDQVQDYNFEIIQTELDNLYEQRLFTLEEYNHFSEMNSNLNVNLTTEAFEQFADELREYHIVRWTTDDLIRGYKTLPGHKRLTLFDALSDHTIVKIDVWAPAAYLDVSPECQQLYGRLLWRFQEFTNWLLITQIDENGERHNLTQDLPEYAHALQQDAEYYITHPQEHKTLKGAKRFWSYLLYYYSVDRDPVIYEMLNRLAPLFSSFPALLNSVAADLDLLLNMKIDRKLPIADSIYREVLQGIIARLDCYSCLYDRDENAIRIVQEGIASVLDGSSDFATTLPELIDFISSYVEETTERYLAANDIDIVDFLDHYPVPEQLQECALLPQRFE